MIRYVAMLLCFAFWMLMMFAAFSDRRILETRSVMRHMFACGQLYCT